jgi:alkyl hydroperoxide reductase subunit D
MSINDLKQQFPVYAADTKINLGKVFDETPFDGLTQSQAFGIALASAYSTKNKSLITAVTAQIQNTLSEAEITAAKGAAAIMAMNNVYYRFVHLASDTEFSKMPAGLRMTFIAKSGINKVDFELYSLAVSAINGCGMCMDAHVHEVTQSGISKQGVQSTIKIAAIINSAAQIIEIENLGF